MIQGGNALYFLLTAQAVAYIISTTILQQKGTEMAYLNRRIGGSYKDISKRINGFVDYNDAATAVTPIVLAENTWTTITNDGQGPATNKLFMPEGVTELMTPTGELDFSELSLGDDIIIRNDFKVSPNVNNALLEFRFLLGTNSYPLETFMPRLDDGSGKYYAFSLTCEYIYMGDTNTQGANGLMQVKLSTGGTLINAGSAIKVTIGGKQ